MAMKEYTKFVYQVLQGGAVKATFCIEQDAIEYAKAIGGTVYKIGAVR